MSAGEIVLPRGSEQELTMEKRLLTKDIELLREETIDLHAKIEEAGKGHSEAEVAMLSEFAKISSYAGLTDLTGQGVKVIINVKPDDEYQPGKYPVKDTDLLKIINDLRGAGAEAISVNEQRILATSEIRESGRHINVNLVRLAPPYVITAIGNSTTLKSSLEIKYGIIEDLQERGLSVTVENSDNVFVPAFSGTLRFDFATPTQEGG